MRPLLTRTQCYLTCHKDLLTWICQWSKGAGLHLFLHEVSCEVMCKVASIMCIHLQIFKRKTLDSKNMQVTKATTYKIQPPCLQHTWDDATQSQTLRFCGGMQWDAFGLFWSQVGICGTSRHFYRKLCSKFAPKVCQDKVCFLRSTASCFGMSLRKLSQLVGET